MIQNTNIYFDYAAATPMSTKVKAAMEPYFSDNFYNPSAQYLSAQSIKKDIEEARADIAEILGAKNSEIIFTAGGTEADNLAVVGVMNQYPGSNCVVSAIEHEAVLAPAALYDCKKAPVKADGRVNLDTLRELIDDKTVLVSVMYANNEIGTVQPLAAVSKLLAEIRAGRVEKGNNLPLYFHTDACQAPNFLRLYVNSLGVDLMTLNAGKIYGPKQTGALYVKTGVILEPVIHGGGQERNLRSGTQNAANIIGFATALKEASALREAENKRSVELLNQAKKYLAENMPEVTLNGSSEFRLPNNLHITLPGTDNERLMMELDEKGLIVAVGSACSASSNEPSHVLKAIGLSDQDARSSLRITFGRQTDKKDIEKLVSTLKQLVA